MMIKYIIMLFLPPYSFNLVLIAAKIVFCLRNWASFGKSQLLNRPSFGKSKQKQKLPNGAKIQIIFASLANRCKISPPDGATFRFNSQDLKAKGNQYLSGNLVSKR